MGVDITGVGITRVGIMGVGYFGKYFTFANFASAYSKILQ